MESLKLPKEPDGVIVNGLYVDRIIGCGTATG